jgi:hypothetical protein
MNIDGAVYTQQEIVYHEAADLALVRFNKPFQGSYGLYAGPLTPPAGESLLEVRMVGFGSMGAVSSNYWTESVTGRGTKRWGSQEIDRTLIKRYDSEGSVGYTENHGFLMEFDLANTAHEAGTGSGDSGGGVFIEQDGVWRLAGISTSRGNVGAQYTSTFAVSIPYYRDWITSVIPEPATTGMLGLSMTGLYLTRTLRRRKKHVRTGHLLFRRTYCCDGFSPSDSKTPFQIRRIFKGVMRTVQSSRAANLIRSSPGVMRIRAVDTIDAFLAGADSAFERIAVRLKRVRNRRFFRGRLRYLAAERDHLPTKGRDEYERHKN